jgi:hypothetical protein
MCFELVRWIALYEFGATLLADWQIHRQLVRLHFTTASRARIIRENIYLVRLLSLRNVS